MKDTIAAIATGNMNAAISVIRISGEEAKERLNPLFSVDLNTMEGNTLRFATVMEDGQPVDEAVVSYFQAPHSYTGEDVFEVSCHGGVYITRKILSLIYGTGIRPARRGEFTERAYLNGKMDLTRAEAVNDLIEAKNALNARNAIHSLKGSVRKQMEPLLESLTQIIAQIEVNIDYPEYDDVEELRDETILPEARQWLTQINRLIETSKDALTVRNGIHVAIVGEPNVGKSSLLNALLEEDKAIVTDIAGTTRDLVEGEVHLEDVTLFVTDTAGIRESEDRIEQIGIEKSKEALEQADLIIYVKDPTQTNDEDELDKLTQGKPCITVYNKKDLVTKEGVLSISALNNDIDPLKEEIKKRFEKGIAAAHADTLNNERQIGLAIEAKQHMSEAINNLQQGAEVDLVTIDLQAAWHALKGITGEDQREDLLDEIFSRFCLGK